MRRHLKLVTALSLASLYLPLPYLTAEDIQEALVLISKEQQEKGGISTLRAGPKKLNIRIKAPGRIGLNLEKVAHIGTKSSGVVKDVYKNLGDLVKAGESLATLESREMAETKSAYLAAVKRKKLSDDLLAREKTLFEKNISPEQDFLKIQSKSAEADINLELAKQKLYALGLNENEIAALLETGGSELRIDILKAPIEGSVILKNIAVGQYLEPNTEVYTIADMTTVWVNLEISPKHLEEIGKGQEVTVQSQGKETKGRLIYICPLVEEGTQTIQATAEIDNKEGLWRPGTYVKTEILVETFPVQVAVLKTAIQKIDGQEVVFVLNDQGFEVRPVETGETDGQFVEIIEGLKINEVYADKNTFLLKATYAAQEEANEDEI